jgi:flagellar basal-body rod modification protein FlgD
MASTDGVTSTGGVDTLTSSGANVTRNTGGTLGKDDFLKLLVGQMKNMDPLGADKSDPSQSMAQMTQFSMLEQLTNLSQSNKLSQSISLIGKNVTYASPGDAAGATTTGKVESVETLGEKVTLTIDGKGGIDPTTVLQVS